MLQAPATGGVPVLLASHQAQPAPKAAAAAKLASGLPWQSGTQCYTDFFETRRGRKVDVNSLYLGRTSWSGVLAALKGDVVNRAKVRPGPLAFAMANRIADELETHAAAKYQSPWSRGR